MEDVFAYQWKMSLNLDRAKQAHEVTFLRKCNKIIDLNSKLSFNERTNNKINKATKGIGLLRKLQPILPRKSLIII